jgi:hypothetical protein
MQPTPFPAAIYQQAKVHQLGVPLNVYRGTPTGCLWHLFWMLAFLCGMSVVTGFPINGINPAPYTSDAFVFGAVAFLIGSLTFFIVVAWPALHTYYACSEGFFGMRGGRVTMALRWNDILRVTKKRHSVNFIPTATNYEVISRQGKEYTVYALALFDQK